MRTKEVKQEGEEGTLLLFGALAVSCDGELRHRGVQHSISRSVSKFCIVRAGVFLCQYTRRIHGTLMMWRRAMNGSEGCCILFLLFFLFFLFELLSYSIFLITLTTLNTTCLSIVFGGHRP
jgi:hypothetical protein